MQRDTLVSFEGVVKRFGAYLAVQKMDFEIRKGEFLAIMGSSGCGKTTTLRMLAGLEAPSEGTIRLSGKPINHLPTWSRDTPMVWQSLALFPFLNVRENVEFALKMRGIGKAERRKRAEHWLDRMQITEFADRNIAQLSGGQRQRVALARSLVVEPEILLLDEPLSALDAALKVRMQSVLKNLQRETGITFVYVTHSQSEAFSMADRVVIMSRGKIEQIGTPQEIYRTPPHPLCRRFPWLIEHLQRQGQSLGRGQRRSGNRQRCAAADHHRRSDPRQQRDADRAGYQDAAQSDPPGIRRERGAGAGDRRGIRRCHRNPLSGNRAGAGNPGAERP